jgi:hypothetical protein
MYNLIVVFTVQHDLGPQVYELPLEALDLSDVVRPRYVSMEWLSALKSPKKKQINFNCLV